MMDAMMLSSLYTEHAKYKEIYDRLKAFIMVPESYTPSTVAPADNELFNIEYIPERHHGIAHHIVGDYTKNEGILYEFYFGRIPLGKEYAQGRVLYLDDEEYSSE
jgi:hypothetical protein